MVKDKIYFASDMHLGSDVMGDSLLREKKLVRWLDSIRDDAKALYLLGDVFDFWFEYKKVVPKGFTRFLGKIAELYDSGVEVHFFTGNHDIWVYDYLPAELGVILHREPLLTELEGKTFYLAHGDGLGDTSRSFRLIRSVFHNRFCQILFSLFPPRLGVGFGHLWSAHSRKKELDPVPYLGENKEHLVLYAKEYLQLHPDTDYFVFGHRHILLDILLNEKSRMVIIGDWMRYFSYAVFDGKKLEVKQFEE